ncbi:hypothetical protein B0H21DRAFT_326620 [Amylocystis lapponica]|nr:hypothetical protein B0H21DRAFT_326620 [Amylocystis lapponica]
MHSPWLIIALTLIMAPLVQLHPILPNSGAGLSDSPLSGVGTGDSLTTLSALAKPDMLLGRHFSHQSRDASDPLGLVKTTTSSLEGLSPRGHSSRKGSTARSMPFPQYLAERVAANKLYARDTSTSNYVSYAGPRPPNYPAMGVPRGNSTSTSTSVTLVPRPTDSVLSKHSKTRKAKHLKTGGETKAQDDTAVEEGT